MNRKPITIMSPMTEAESKARYVQVDSNHQPIRHFTERHYEPGKIVEIPQHRIAVARRAQ
jgi:hypothetical protein